MVGGRKVSNISKIFFVKDKKPTRNGFFFFQSHFITSPNFVFDAPLKKFSKKYNFYVRINMYLKDVGI